jgi:hypothetical protein
MSDELNDFLSFNADQAPSAAAVADPPETPTDETPTEGEPAEPSSPAPRAAWLDEVIDDPDLPPSLRGSKVSDYVAKTKRALTDAHVAGMEKNKALAELEAQRLFNQALEKRLAQLPTTAPTPQAQPQMPKFETEEDVVSYVKKTAAELAEQQLQPIKQTVEQMQREKEEAVFRTQAESARSLARAYVPGNISEETWDDMREDIAARVWAMNGDPRDPNVWAAAGQAVFQRAHKLVPQQVVTPKPGAPPVGNGRPHGTSAAPKPPVSTGNKRTDAALKDILDAWNRKAKLPIHFEDVARDIAESRTLGDEE